MPTFLRFFPFMIFHACQKKQFCKKKSDISWIFTLISSSYLLHNNFFLRWLRQPIYMVAFQFCVGISKVECSMPVQWSAQILHFIALFFYGESLSVSSKSNQKNCVFSHVLKQIYLGKKVDETHQNVKTAPFWQWFGCIERNLPCHAKMTVKYQKNSRKPR